MLYLMRNLKTRDPSETNWGDKNNDVTNNLVCQGVSPGYVSTSYHVSKLKKWKKLVFFHVKLGQEIIIGNLKFAQKANNSYLKLGSPKMTLK